jgi:acyl carrier protein
VNPTQLIDRETLEKDVLLILSDMTQDWDNTFSGPITGSTLLVADLGFQSIDVVMLISEIHRFYRGKQFPFGQLFLTKVGYADDVKMSSVIDFMHAHWNDPA